MCVCVRGGVLCSDATHWKRTEAQLHGGPRGARSAELLLCVVVCCCETSAAAAATPVESTAVGRVTAVASFHFERPTKTRMFCCHNEAQLSFDVHGLCMRVVCVIAALLVCESIMSDCKRNTTSLRRSRSPSHNDSFLTPSPVYDCCKIPMASSVETMATIFQ